MTLVHRLGRRAVLLIGIVVGLGAASGEAGPSAAQMRGKQIYLEGTSPSGGDITAIVGAEGVALPASAVPCASCHGPDGLGRPEGGVLPPDIRWSALTKTYGHVHSDGRRHPAFDQAAVARVLRTGLDPADNRLDRSMPLYAMSQEDMNALLAYLKYLELDHDPGVQDDRIQVATLLPLRGPQGGLGQAMAQVMHAYFEDVNSRGGVFGRRVELLVVPFGDTPEATLDGLRLALASEGVFALVGAYTIGLDQPVLDLLREEGVPLIGPFTLDPGDAITDAAAFYLYPGFVEQSRTLVDAAVEKADAGTQPLVVVAPQDRQTGRLVEAVRDQARLRKVSEPRLLNYTEDDMRADELAERVAGADSDALIFLGDQAELERLLAALSARESSPRIYLLSSLMPRPLFDAPAAFHYRIFLAFPTLSSDVSADGRAAYARLARDHALPPDHLQGQIAAYAAAKLLVEGLRGAGRAVNRVRLVEALEALYAYDTGLTPPLTYGPNRRIGARGAHVLAVDLMKKTYQPVGGWQALP
jgi:ABC-type branched-subunit amino acid transport system substrate-binding protein